MRRAREEAAAAAAREVIRTLCCSVCVRYRRQTGVVSVVGRGRLRSLRKQRLLAVQRKLKLLDVQRKLKLLDVQRKLRLLEKQRQLDVQRKQRLLEKQRKQRLLEKQRKTGLLGYVVAFPSIVRRSWSSFCWSDCVVYNGPDRACLLLAAEGCCVHGRNVVVLCDPCRPVFLVSPPVKQARV